MSDDFFAPAPFKADEALQTLRRHLRELNRKEKVSFLLAEQNTNIALRYADYGYILETGRIVLDGPAATLRENEDVREFYLGTGGSGADGERKSYRAVKSYKRRKRWLA